MKSRMLNRRQVIARMKKGDLPSLSPAGSDMLYFEDGMRASHKVGRGLLLDHVIEKPQSTSCDAKYTLAVASKEN